MPIPKPNKNEKESDFIQRCMGNPAMNKEYPDQKQRSGICYTQWRRKDKSDFKIDDEFKFECSECGLPTNDDDGVCYKCGGELIEFQKVNMKTIVKNGFESPEFDENKLSKHQQDILASTYASCRTQWVKKNPGDKENKANKESCARIAWNAVKQSNMKLETVDIDKDIHIFTAGKWKGHDYTINELDDMINNYNNKVAEPYITLDHNPGLTKSTQEFFRAMGLGFVKRLKRTGENIYANFRKVPKMIAELIDAGAMKQRSVEFVRNFNHANGKNYNLVLTGVTFHGGNGLPAISTLEDIPKLFKDNDTDFKIKSTVQNKGEFISIPADEFKSIKQEEKIHNIGENNMEISIEKYQQMTDDIANLKAENKRLTEKEEQFKADKEDADKKYDEAVQLKKEADEKLETFEKAQETQMKSEATVFVDKLINDKKRLPKFKDMDIARYIELKRSGDEKALELFKEDLQGRSKVDLEGNIIEEDENGDPVNFKLPEYNTEKDVKKNDFKDWGKVDKAIKSYMKANGLVGAEGYQKAYTVIVEQSGGGGEVM